LLIKRHRRKKKNYFEKKIMIEKLQNKIKIIFDSDFYTSLFCKKDEVMKAPIIVTEELKIERGIKEEELVEYIRQLQGLYNQAKKMEIEYVNTTLTLEIIDRETMSSFLIYKVFRYDFERREFEFIDFESSAPKKLIIENISYRLENMKKMISDKQKLISINGMVKM